MKAPPLLRIFVSSFLFSRRKTPAFFRPFLSRNPFVMIYDKVYKFNEHIKIKSCFLGIYHDNKCRFKEFRQSRGGAGSFFGIFSQLECKGQFPRGEFGNFKTAKRPQAYCRGFNESGEKFF